jgi:hypothetical protein
MGVRTNIPDLDANVTQYLHRDRQHMLRNKYFERQSKCSFCHESDALQTATTNLLQHTGMLQHNNNNNNNHHYHTLFATTTYHHMKLKIKDVARHLVQNEDVNMPVFLKRQLAQQLVRSSKRLPGAMRDWITKKIFPSVVQSALNQEEALQEELAPTPLPIAEPTKTRRHCIRRRDRKRLQTGGCNSSPVLNGWCFKTTRNTETLSCSRHCSELTFKLSTFSVTSFLTTNGAILKLLTFLDVDVIMWSCWF